MNDTKSNTKATAYFRNSKRWLLAVSDVPAKQAPGDEVVFCVEHLMLLEKLAKNVPGHIRSMTYQELLEYGKEPEDVVIESTPPTRSAS